MRGKHPKCQSKAWILTIRIQPMRIRIEGNPHVHVEARRAVANEVPPIDSRPEQPLSRFSACRWLHVGHAHSLTPNRSESTSSRHRRSDRGVHEEHRNHCQCDDRGEDGGNSGALAYDQGA